MKKLITISLLSLFLVTPFFTFAATQSGLTPNSPFYFFDTLSEKIILFFTFNPEKKVTKALLFAEERLAEASVSADEDKPEVIEALMTNYQANVSLASEKSKEVKDEKKAEELLNKIADNTAKHQEVLTEVLTKVPEIAKEAIEKAIETSKRGQEEALKQISELKKEIEALKQEIVELKKQQKIEPAPTQATEIKELRKELEGLKNQAAKKEDGKQVVPPVAPVPTVTPAPEPKPEVKVEDPILVLNNSLGISYTFDTRVNNNSRIQDLIDVGFFVTQGKLPEGIITKQTVTSIPVPVSTTEPVSSIPATTPTTQATPAIPVTPSVPATTSVTPILAKVYKSQHHTIYDSFYSGPSNEAVFVIFIEAPNSDLYLDNMKDIDLEIISDDFVKSDLNIRFDTETQNKKYIPAGQKWAAQLNFDTPSKSGKFQVVLNGLKTHVLSNKPVIFEGFPIKSNVISIKGPVDNLLVNVKQIPVDSPWPDYIAQFRVTYDESITLNDFSFTFNNPNPLARLYNVDLGGTNIPVIAPGNTIKFSGEKNFDVDVHELNKTFVKDFVLKGSNEAGWNIVFNSATTKRKYFPSLPITLTGLPISVFPRDRSLKLELLPSTLSGLISPGSYGRYNILELKLTREHRNLAIRGAKLLLVGETVNDNGNSNKVAASVIDQSNNTYVIKQQPFESGISKAYAYGNPGTWHQMNSAWWPTIIVQLDIVGAKPGTNWKATLLDIEFFDRDTGAEIHEIGLPISNEIRL